MIKPMIIGIGGGTGSGKTTAAKKIVTTIGADLVLSLKQDSYYRNLADMPLDRRRKANYDHPDAFDNGLLFNHLERLRAGESIQQPVYDFVTHSRTPGSIRIDPLPLLVVEGILVLFDSRMRQYMDLKIFMDCEADIRFVRRLRRDMTNRGRSAESVVEQYLSTVRPMHLQFVEPSRRYADIILAGDGSGDASMESIIERIRSFLAAPDPTR